MRRDAAAQYHRDPEGRLHRVDGPAVLHPHGTQEWFWHGIRHRADGPAVVHANGHYEFWVNGFCRFASWDPERRHDLRPLRKEAWDLKTESGVTSTFDNLLYVLKPYQLWVVTPNPKFPFNSVAMGGFCTGPNLAAGEVYEDANIHWRGLDKTTMRLDGTSGMPNSADNTLRDFQANPDRFYLVRRFNEPFRLALDDWRDQLANNQRMFGEASLKLWSWEVQPDEHLHEGPYQIDQLEDLIKPYQVWSVTHTERAGSSILYVGGDATIRKDRAGEPIFLQKGLYQDKWPTQVSSKKLHSIEWSSPWIWPDEGPFYLEAHDWRPLVRQAGIDPRTGALGQLPELHNTQEAWAYGAQMAPDQIPTLQAERARLLQEAGDETQSFDERLETTLQAQLLREAMERYYELHPQTKTAALHKLAFADEIFRWFSAVFDMQAAQKILKDHPREPQDIQVDKWAPLLIVHADDDEGNPIRGPVPDGKKAIVPLVNVSINWDHVKDVDSKKPGIMVPFSGSYLLADGHHRLAKVWQQHQEMFPVYILTEDETKSILRKPLKLKEVEHSESSSTEESSTRT